MRLSVFFISLLALIMAFCNRNTTPADSPYLNLADGVKYMGMETCRTCHTNVHATFIHTGMGRSFDLATPSKSAATYGAHAIVYDTVNDLYYKPFFRDSALYILEFRLEGRDTVHKRLEKVSYIVGSGQHTNSHIVDVNGYIYQAPITYYTQEKRWDLAPGFDEFNERFDRILTAECITCHNHYPQLVEGAINKYAQMPRGIECERCHGPGEIHVREKLAGRLVDTATQIDYTIVNPRDLPRDLQMDLCQRCHLQGVAVLEDGKTFFDFKPGMPLNQVMNVFMPRFSNSSEKFIMASQADRLRLSACYKLSEMTCLTCHNPHLSVKETGRQQYNNACQGCHTRQTCTAPMAERRSIADDCSACHMPRSGSTDIPHVNITDHFISKTNIAGKNAASTSAKKDQVDFLGLQILTKDSPTPLEMAKGYIAVYDKYLASPVMLDSAKWYLDRSKAPRKQQFPVLVHYYFTKKDFGAIANLAAKIDPAKETDGWTAYRIGEAMFQTGNYPVAVAFYERSLALLPYQLDFREKLGVAYAATRQIPQAIAALEWVLKENPKRKIALANLGYIYVSQRQFEKGEALYDKALALDPDYEQALLNKAAVRLFRNDCAAAAPLLRRILKRNPSQNQARRALAQCGE